MTTFNVTNLNDSGAGSLRHAIAQANANSGADEIKFTVSGKITLSGEMAITDSVKIDGDINGDDKADIIVDGNDAGRIFTMTGTATAVALNSLTLQNGKTTGVGGGAIFANDIASLAIADTTVTSSDALYTNFVDVDNVDGDGGGILAVDTDVTLTNSLLWKNVAQGDGGGICVSGGQLDMVNTTVDGNASAGGRGGGVSLFDTQADIDSCTITDNFNFGGGAGGLNGDSESTAEISNTAFWLNTCGVFLPWNPFATMPSEAFVIATAANVYIGSEVTDIDDWVVFDAKLGELLDNGGTVLSRVPLDGSPVIDAGNGTLLPADMFDLDHDGNVLEPIPLDGRGGPRIAGSLLDIGAAEQRIDEFIVGTDGNNKIIGGIGNDTLAGGNGNDTLDGGTGIDVAAYVNATGAIVVDLSNPGAQNTLGAGFDVLSGIETVWGSAFGDTLTGSSGGEWLAAGGGDDTLAGGLGNDTLKGGTGFDIASYAGAGGPIQLNLSLATAQNTGSAGTDTLTSIEGAFGSSFGDLLIGSAQANSLKGNGQQDALLGAGGMDTLDGGVGDDIVLGGEGSDSIAGGDGNDWLYGNDDFGDIELIAAGDSILGGVGADYIQGNLGADTLGGGAGNDRIFADREWAFDDVSGNLLNGAAGNDQLTGASSNDTLKGGIDNDTLDGGGGLDRMIGSTGDDRYFVDRLSDVIVEIVGEGSNDVVISPFSSYALAAGVAVELLGTGNAAGTAVVNFTGNEFAQLIRGNAAANRLEGKGGIDTMQGYTGDDTYIVDQQGDVIVETAGQGSNDTVVSALTSYTLAAGVSVEQLGTGNTAGTTVIDLTGNEFGQLIKGNAAANRLEGKGGADTMQGFAGNDRFVFRDGDGADTVSDFANNGAEKFDLSGLTTGAQSFAQLAITDTAGPGVTVNYGTGSILIANINAVGQIDAGDFLF